jgi:hypothetical protein
MQLSIPHRRQIGDGFCLPTCVEMVLASLDLEHSQTDIAHALGTRPNLGTPFFVITQLTSRIRALRKLRIEFYETGEPQDLERALQAGTAPILRILTGQLPYWSENTPHAVVLTGLKNDIATINDPAFDKPQQVPFGDLCLAWDDRGNSYAVITRCSQGKNHPGAELQHSDVAIPPRRRVKTRPSEAGSSLCGMINVCLSHTGYS